MTRFTRIVLLAMLPCLLPADVGHGRETAKTGRISIENGNVTLKNSLGCKLVFDHKDGKYGLGTFYLKDVKLGGTASTFLDEDNHYKWEDYRAARYEIIEDSPEKSAVRFSGTVGTGVQTRKFSVTITLPDKIPAYSIDYEAGLTAFGSPKHPLYASIPFSNRAMEFVQYPMETPVTAPFRGQWSVVPHMSKVPLMFGCEKIDGEEFFVGVGYRLTGQDFTEGRLQYDTWNPDVPLKVFFPYRWYKEPRFHPQPYKLSMIVSTAKTQSDCIEGYMNLSGYDLFTPVRRTIDDSLSALMRALKTVPLKAVYVEGKGYRMRARSNSDEVCSYYPYLEFCRNVQLAYQLYKYWESHPDETWAKTRALEMADFFVASQEKDGSLPLIWSPEHGYGTYYPPLEKGGYIYSTAEMSLGAYNLYKIYLERKSFEKVDCEKWKNAAVKAMDYIVDKMGADGSLGRTFNKKGQYDDLYPAGWALIALDYFHEKTGNEKYRQAMEKAERWNYKTYVRTNNYYNTCVDATYWSPEGNPPQDHDTQTATNFANYYAFRYAKTRDPSYLQFAKDVVFFDWLERVPIEIPGYKYPTRGVGQEQDVWPTFDGPWEVETRDCLPYLSKVTGDKFYAAFYKILIQTEMGFQAIDKKYPFNYIGLHPHPDREGPEDRLAEGDEVWISFTSFFLVDLNNSKSSHRYLGGRNWGVGLDYDLTFTPNAGPEEPYVVCASGTITSARWNAPKKELAITLTGKAAEHGAIAIKWDPKKSRLSQTRIAFDGEQGKELRKYFDPDTETLRIEYVQKQPSAHDENSLRAGGTKVRRIAYHTHRSRRLGRLCLLHRYGVRPCGPR